MGNSASLNIFLDDGEGDGEVAKRSSVTRTCASGLSHRVVLRSLFHHSFRSVQWHTPDNHCGAEWLSRWTNKCGEERWSWWCTGRKRQSFT
jgi:hypothetical protein